MLNRRGFCAVGGQALAFAGVPGAARAQSRQLTALEILAPLAGLADAALIAGRPNATVTGVALLADPGLAALRRAVAAGASLILSPETPFYARAMDPATGSGPFAAMAAGATAALHDSPAYKAKQAFIADQDLTVYRLTPRTALRDMSAEALAARLGWTGHRLPGRHPIYAPPGLTVGRLVRLARDRLGASGGLRFIGEPAMPLGSILIVPGTADVVSTTQALRRADALLTGDLREWEVVTYIRDSIDAGIPKALVATGRILSEQPFVERCALAVKQAFPLTPLHAPAQADPFWRVPA
jgi:hypothetical protein